MSTSDPQSVHDLIERSSLGTPQARRQRALTPPHVVDRILARSRVLLAIEAEERAPSPEPVLPAVDSAGPSLQEVAGPLDKPQGTVKGAPRPPNGPGFEEEWAEVYEAHFSAVVAFATERLGNGAWAEEVAQDVFVRLWTRSEIFNPTQGSLRNYLLTQARWRCVDSARAEESRRNRERRAAATTELYGVLHSEPQDVVAEREDIHTLLAALVDLPLNERVPIDLTYFGGLTHHEVAKVLEWPEGMVRSRIWRGLRRIREQVGDRSEA